MAQKIGLEAVLNMVDFNRGVKDYTSGIDHMTARGTTFAQKVGSVGKVIGGIGLAAGAVAIGGLAALGKGLWECAQEAIESQEATAALDAVIKSTGRDAKTTRKMTDKYAKSLQLTTRFSDEQVMAAETMLLQFKEMNEKTFPEAITLTADIATRLGTDMPSAAKLLGKALAEPGEGLTRLKQAGITFTDAEEKAIKAMYDAGDAAGAQKAIMDKLTVSVGGAAVAAGETYAGKVDRIRNAWSDVKETLGAPVLNALDILSGKLATALGSPQVQAAVQDITNWLSVNLPKAIDGAIAFISSKAPAFQAAWKAFRQVLEDMGVVGPEAKGPGLEALAAGFRRFGTAPVHDRLVPPIFTPIRDDLLAGATAPSLGKEIGKQLWANVTAGTMEEAAVANEQMNSAISKWLDLNVWKPFKDWFADFNDRLWNLIKGTFAGTIFQYFGVPVPGLGNPYGGPTGQSAPGGTGAPGMSAITAGQAIGAPVVAASAGMGIGSTVIGGDTIVQNISDPATFFLAQAMVADRKRDRWNAAMGVA